MLPVPASTSSLIAAQLAVMRRRWRVSATGALLVLAVLLPFALGLPSLYRASATILVEDRAAPGSDLLETGELDQRLQAIKQEAVSRTRLKDLIERTHLASPASSQPASRLDVTELQRDIRLEIVGTSASSRSGQPHTVAFKLSYVGRDPATVARVANSLADFYVAQNDALRSRAVTDTTAHLKEALDRARLALTAQERRVAQFTAGNSGSLPQQADANQAALIRMNVELQSNMAEQARQRERRQIVSDRIMELRANPPADADPELRLARLRQELADLRLSETDQSPNVRAKQREIAAAVQQIEGTKRPGAGVGGTSRLGTLQAEIQAIDQRLEQLARDLDQLRLTMGGYQARLERAPAQGTALQSIMHEYEAARDLHDSLQKRYAQAQLAERAEQGERRAEFRVLDAALPPTEPSGPNRLLLCLGAVLVALAFGIGLAYLVDMFDTSFHDVDDLRMFTRVPVLASIPLIVSPEDAQRHRAFSRRALVSTVVLILCVGVAAFFVARGSDDIARLFLRRT